MNLSFIRKKQKQRVLSLLAFLTVSMTFSTSMLAEPLGQGTSIPSSASPSRAAEETAAKPTVPNAESDYEQSNRSERKNLGYPTQ
jgi:hypothetical protein